MKIILASASERRQELLARLVENFTIIVSDFDEKSVEYKGNIDEYVQDIAYGKANDIAKTINEDAIIIAADTIVVLDDEILGKPKNDEDARNMLEKISGKVHNVCSGVVLINTGNGRIIKTSQKTEVRFSELTSVDIDQYIKTKEPLDKAGSYGIQGIGGTFVEEIKGCYYNVVGLPLNKLRLMLNEII